MTLIFSAMQYSIGCTTVQLRCTSFITQWDVT